MSSKPEYIVVGRFGRPRDVSGDIYITPATDDIERFGELETILVVGNGERRRFEIERFWIVSDRPVIKLKGIDSREDAARLTNLSIEIPIEQARPLTEGRHYQFDLIGCRVKGKDGNDFGELVDIDFYPSSDIYRIRSEKYGEVLFPAVDIFIISVDTEKKEIIIDPPPGLFETEKTAD